MSARLASQKAFREAGIDYATALYDLRFAIDKRANGSAVLKITSSNPVNDPFMDLLVELSWPDGPVVREYTFLLDPPEIAAKAAGRPVSTAEARVVDTVRNAPVAATPAVRSDAPRPSLAAPKAAVEPRKAQEAGTHVVQQGETLRKIAGETKYEGVSLEQMLVGLYKKNPDAFIGDNINRLKAGAILSIPDKAAVAAVSEADAKQVYQAQANDWGAYRQKLAGAVAQGQTKPEDASQSASGKITARVDEKTPSVAPSKDQVKVSKAELPGKGGAGGKSVPAAEEDLIAKERALKEAQDRLAQLEKNVGELQKLVDMKTQRLAELQQQASGKKDEVKPAAPAVAVEPAKPVVPAEPPKAAEPAPAPAAEPPKVAEAPKPVEEPPKVAEAAKPAEPPKAPEVKAPEVPRKEAVAPAPEPESDFDLLPLIGGGGLIALLAGFFFMRRRRSEPEAPMTTAVPGPASLGPNSVFRMTGGQSVDTGNVPLQTGEFSQTGPGTIDTDEVDPVAEADVYMAYGRDAQAEEILIEALRKDPHRTAIHAKLLEIYSNRKSLKQFDTLASELYAQTGGVGPDWEKVAAMGVALDPSNPLYAAGKAILAVAPETASTKSPTDGNKSTVVMPGALGAMAAATMAAGEQLAVPELPQVTREVGDAGSSDGDYAQTVMNKDVNSLDFDLATSDSKPEAILEPEPLSLPELEALDFDLGTSSQNTVVQSSPSQFVDVASTDTANNFSATTIVGLDEVVAHSDFSAPETAAIDFQLDSAAPLSDTVVNPGLALETTNDQATIIDGSFGMGDAQYGNGEEFNIDLSESVFIGNPIKSNDFDMTTINLDLAAADQTQVINIVDGSGNFSTGADPVNDEVATKLALAKAYEEMGDHSQARELLEEVIAEGNSDLAQQARDMIGRLQG
jgi:pilus assembly protein FimV